MRILALITLPLLAACTATVPPVEVTRFHLNQPIAPGGVTVTGWENWEGEGLEHGTYRAAVQRQFARLGFTDGDGPYVAEVAFRRNARERVGGGRSGVSIGIGGGGFSWGRRGGGGVGVGVGTSFGVGGGGRGDVATGLKVRLKRKGSDAILWEGEAETLARFNAPAAQPGLAADKLAAALFAGFPGESGRTIRVP